MKGVWLCVAVCLLADSAAVASGYSDFNTGVAAADRGDTDQAIKYLTAAISEADTPKHLLPAAHLAKGNVYDGLQRYDEAIAEYSATIAIDKDNVRAYMERCGTHGLKKEFAEAIADCSAAIRLQPDDWRLYEMRIPYYIKTKRFDDALADFATFIAKRPGDTELRTARAEVLRLAGRVDEAVASTLALRDASPKDVSPYIELALIYLASNDLQKSLDNMKTVTDLADKAPEGHLLKGEVEWALGRYNDAQDSFEDALDLSELQPYAFLWLEITRARRGRKQDSRVESRFAGLDLTVWPGPIISLYLGKSTPEDVIKFKDAVPCTTDFFVGEWYQMQGNSADAKRLLRDAADACDSDWTTRQFAALDLARLP